MSNIKNQKKKKKRGEEQKKIKNCCCQRTKVFQVSPGPYAEIIIKSCTVVAGKAQQKELGVNFFTLSYVYVLIFIFFVSFIFCPQVVTTMDDNESSIDKNSLYHEPFNVNMYTSAASACSMNDLQRQHVTPDYTGEFTQRGKRSRLPVAP